jgi:MerR family transcriptional regulator, redox-sensitive transcriptional activator SoxR
MIDSMLLSISEVASHIGLRPSAIRYYEQIGILPPAQRVSGQRRYDVTALHRLVVIQRGARQTGFTLTEIKQLFFGFRAGTPPSVRWQKLKSRKMVELDAMLEHIQTMRALLDQQGKCRCTALEECGKKIFEKQCANPLGTRRMSALKVQS